MAVRIQVDDEEDIKGDMTPMIDIIFLLLIFFILTTKFIPEEKVIASLLPTNKGQSSASTPLEEKHDVNVLIYPGVYERGQQPSWYDKDWKANYFTQEAVYRVSNRPHIKIDGDRLTQKTARQNEQLEQVHSYIYSELEAFEKPGAPRKEQDPIVIHCFSGLPWKYALAAYDAIRAFEAQKVGTGELRPEDILNAREVNFAPPRIRNYRKWEMGYELFEIIHMK